MDAEAQRGEVREDVDDEVPRFTTINGEPFLDEVTVEDMEDDGGGIIEITEQPQPQPRSLP